MLDTPFWIADMCDADMCAKCDIMQKAREEATIADCEQAYEACMRGGDMVGLHIGRGTSQEG